MRAGATLVLNSFGEFHQALRVEAFGVEMTLKWSWHGVKLVLKME